MIDEKALDKVILDHYKKKLFSEFRNHMIFESQDQAQIFNDYLKEVERKKVERKRMLDMIKNSVIGLIAISIVPLFVFIVITK